MTTTAQPTEAVTAADLRVGDRIIDGGRYETVSGIEDAGPGYRGPLLNITVVRSGITRTHLGGRVETGITEHRTATWVATETVRRVARPATLTAGQDQAVRDYARQAHRTPGHPAAPWASPVVQRITTEDPTRFRAACAAHAAAWDAEVDAEVAAILTTP